MPLFSVLIANYNNGKYLEECLASIFAQTYKNWEIIIVDDASTDSSREIYSKYLDNNNIHVFYNKKNKGVGYTKRKCAENAKGEICGFVDPDDIISSDALELMTKAHQDFPGMSIIYSTHFICDKTLKPLQIADYVGQIPLNEKSWSVKRPIISQFATFKRSKYLNTKGISGIFKKAADKDLYYKLEETGPVMFIDKPLYYYRHHENSISLNNNGSAAYQYELMAKAMIVLRHNKSRAVIEKMPHSRDELAKGIMIVIVTEAGKLKILSATKLLFQLIYFSPLSILWIINIWLRNNLK
jgi:glycosyltransferase involved in cell wall biosynthesis